MNINVLNLQKELSQSPDEEELLQLYQTYVVPDDQETHEDFICSLVIYKHKKNIATHKILSLVSLYKPKNYYVYKLYLESELVYVGSTVNLESRLVKHLEDKVFDCVKVCEKQTKGSMLHLEHVLIKEYSPKYNKECNLKNVRLYEGNLDNEIFIHLEDFMYTKKISKSMGHQLTKLFTNKVPLYERVFLNGWWFVVNDSPDPRYKRGKPVKVGGEVVYVDYGCKLSWVEMLEDVDMLKHLKTNKNTNIHTFYNTFIVAGKKYRYKGSNVWYNYKSMERLTEKMIKYVEEDKTKHLIAISNATTPTFWFGKYKGYSVESVKIKDTPYLEWCMDNLEDQTKQKLNLQDGWDCIKD